jgi:hypothetical protein
VLRAVHHLPLLCPPEAAEARGHSPYRPAPRGASPQGPAAGSPEGRRLAAERAVLQLAWIGLVALREGFCADPSGYAPGPAEPLAEEARAFIVPELEEGAAVGRSIDAYRRAADLDPPRRARLIDTEA